MGVEQMITEGVSRFNNQMQEELGLNFSIEELQAWLNKVYFQTIDFYIQNYDRQYYDKNEIGNLSFGLHSALVDSYNARVFW